ncbi:MAG: hypothetical protein RJA07_1376 [Bacteroidota bacterium]|jgi:hypothetical protein
MKLFFTSILFTALICSFYQIHAQSKCATSQYIANELNQNSLLLRQYDSITKKIYADAKTIATQSSFNHAKSTTMKVRYVPVVVHILYDTIIHDISNAQVLSQIKVLNDDYLAMNANLWKTQSVFTNRIGISGIQFYIANKAPNGADTFAIIHKHTAASSFAANNLCKHNSSNGDNAWDTKKYFNIWVVILNDPSILGYSSLPGTSLALGGNDGTVINHLYFGLSGIANAPFNLGRTGTHETGHFFGLQHTFEYGCNAEGDSIKDTPPVLSYNIGCSKGANSCHNDSPDEIDMVENYMDYSDDGCMTMFSQGQVAVFQSVLHNYRDSLGYDSTITFTTNIGINDESNSLNNKLSIYPNPAKEWLMINDKWLVVNTIEITDVLGRIQNIIVEKINTNDLRLMTERLPSGIYFIKAIDTNGNILNSKFVKE